MQCAHTSQQRRAVIGMSRKEEPLSRGKSSRERHPAAVCTLTDVNAPLFFGFCVHAPASGPNCELTRRAACAAGAQSYLASSTANLIQLWQTVPMVSAVKPSAKRSARKHTTTVEAVPQPKTGAAVKRVQGAGGSDFRFPALSGAEAAALMKAAGIVDNHGKLTKMYR